MVILQIFHRYLQEVSSEVINKNLHNPSLSYQIYKNLQFRFLALRQLSEVNKKKINNNPLQLLPLHKQNNNNKMLLIKSHLKIRKKSQSRDCLVSCKA